MHRIRNNSSTPPDPSTSRLSYIDIIKGLAIILMVMGHAGFPYTHFLYLFHMAVFFMASGYCWNARHSQSLTSCIHYIVKKIFALYLPFVLCNGIFLALNNVLIDLHILATNTDSFQLVTNQYYFATASRLSAREIAQQMVGILTFEKTRQLGGATWFLRALFWVSVGHCLWMWVLHFLGKRWSDVILAATFICCCVLYEQYRGGFFSAQYVLWFQAVLGYIAYLLGVMLRRLRELFKEKADANGDGSLLLPLSFCVLLWLNTFVQIHIDRASVTNVFLYIVASVAGWCFLYSLSQSFCTCAPLSAALQTIGQHTLSILMLHFLSFKIVTLGVCLATDLPIDIVAFFPSLTINGWLWIAYSAVGVIVPMLCGKVYSSIRNRVLERSVHV